MTVCDSCKEVFASEKRKTDISWGSLISALVIIVAAGVYILVKGIP